MSEKPAVAFVLSLVGGVLILINGVWVLAIGKIIGATGIIRLVEVFARLIGLLGALGTVFGILVIISSAMMYHKDPSRVRNWSTIALIFSVLSLITGGGFLVGFVLGLVGSILGLTWKPE